MTNFRQFKGEQIIEFSTDPDKNITAIIGENSQGKTTFVHSFRWLLYEDDNFKKREKSSGSSILNADVEKNMRKGDKALASVKLVLTYRGTEYTILRTQKFVSRESGSAVGDIPSLKIDYKNAEGRTVPIEETPLQKIDVIYPKGLADYLFFDGEKDITAGENVESAVNTIMGLDVLKNILDHSEKAYSRFEKRLTGSGNDDNELRELSRRKDRENENIKTANAKIEQYEKDVQAFDKQMSEYRELHEQNKETIQFEKDRQRYEIEVKNKKSKLSSGLTELLKRQSDKIIDLFSYPLLESSMEIVSKENLSNKGIPNMNSDALKYILDQGICICGKNLNEDEDALKNINDLFKYLPPESIGTIIRDFQTNIKRSEEQIKDLVSDLQYRYKIEYLEKIETLDKSETELENVRYKLLKAPGDFNIEEKIQALEKKRSDREKLKYSEEENKRKSDKEIERLDRELKNKTSLKKENAKTNLRMEYAHQIYKRAKKEYDIKSETNLSTLKETIQSVFDSMFHGVKGERIVRVDKKYNVTLPIGNRNLDTSEGTDVVKNFAFIATLLKMAKDYSIGGDGEITSEPMPLVMDAPFSKTDAKHIQNISKEIPRLSQQTIVTMLDIQWKNASKTMGDRVGITYRLDQKSQTHTDIVREV